jgi:hypothetical protein
MLMVLCAVANSLSLSLFGRWAVDLTVHACSALLRYLKLSYSVLSPPVLQLLFDLGAVITLPLVSSCNSTVCRTEAPQQMHCNACQQLPSMP